MNQHFFRTFILLGFCVFSVPVLLAQSTQGGTPLEIDKEIQKQKTCVDFCTFKDDTSPNEDCVNTCTGCLFGHVENYPKLGHAVCSGSHGAWIDPVNNTQGKWETAYESCPDTTRKIQVKKIDGSGLLEPLPNQADVPVSDMYRLSRKSDGTWGVESLNPYCYESGKGDLIDYSTRSDQILWWERIDGPLVFQSVLQPKQHQPLIANCSEPITYSWLSNIDNYGDFIGTDQSPGCYKKTSTQTDHNRLVTICPAATDDSNRNYLPNEQVACSKGLFEVKLNCECQQLGLNAWLKAYESQGSYLTNLQNYYAALGGEFYYLQDGDDKTPTRLQVFGSSAPDAAKIKVKTEYVLLSDFLKLDAYKTSHAKKIIELEGNVHWTGEVLKTDGKETQITVKKTIDDLLKGTGTGLSWKKAPRAYSAQSDQKFFQEDFNRITDLMIQIAKQNDVEKDDSFNQFMKDIQLMMHQVGLKTQGSLKTRAEQIDAQLSRWTSVIYDSDGSDMPKSPLAETTIDSGAFPNPISKKDSDVNKILPVPSFTDFQTEYKKLENKRVKLLKPRDENQQLNPEYEKFQILKQKRLDLQKKIGLIRARMGSLKQSQQVNSTTSYPVSRVLKTKYETRTTNGSGGKTVSPGSTEAYMVLLQHERNEAYCRETFADLNALKKSALPEDSTEFQNRRDTIRRMEANYQKICKNNFIDKIIYTVSQVLGTAAILMIIVGCYFLVTAQGDDSQISKGKNYLQYAAIGLVISFMSYTIVQFIIDAILW